MFQAADHCLIRVANAAAPSQSWYLPKTAYGPNMAVKCFADGATPSANLQTIWEVDGYDVIPDGNAASCSYFDVPLSNHCGRRDNVSFALRESFQKSFQEISSQGCWTGVSQMATAGQDGGVADAPGFPFALVFKPAAALKDVPCEFDDVMSQLFNVEEAGFVGKEIYGVYAVHDPWYARAPRGSIGPRTVVRPVCRYRTADRSMTGIQVRAPRRRARPEADRAAGAGHAVRDQLLRRHGAVLSALVLRGGARRAHGGGQRGLQPGAELGELRRGALQGGGRGLVLAVPLNGEFQRRMKAKLPRPSQR